MRDAVDATEEAGNAVTADLFTGITADLDKQIWFVESYLQRA